MRAEEFGQHPAGQQQPAASEGVTCLLAHLRAFVCVCFCFLFSFEGFLESFESKISKSRVRPEVTQAASAGPSGRFQVHISRAAGKTVELLTQELSLNLRLNIKG